MNNFPSKSFRIPFKDCHNFQIDYESIQIILNVEWLPPGQNPNLVIHITNRSNTENVPLSAATMKNQNKNPKASSGSSCESRSLHGSQKDSQDAGLASFNANQFATSKTFSNNEIQLHPTEFSSLSMTIPSILDRSENRTSPSTGSQRTLTSSNSSSPSNMVLASNGVQKQSINSCSTTQSPPNLSIYSTDQQISTMIASPNNLFPSTIKPLYCSCANPNNGHTDNCPAKESQKSTLIVTNSPISSSQFLGTMFERLPITPGSTPTLPSDNLDIFQSNGMRPNQTVPENRLFHAHFPTPIDGSTNILAIRTIENDTMDDFTPPSSQWMNISDSSEKITPVQMPAIKKQKRVSSGRPKKVSDKRDNHIRSESSNMPITSNNDQNDQKIGETSDQSCAHMDHSSLLIICEESPKSEENADTDISSKSNTQNAPRSPISIDPDLLKKRTSTKDESMDRVKETIEKVVEQCRNSNSTTDLVQSSVSNPSQTVNQQGSPLKKVDLSTESIINTINDQSRTQIQSATNSEKMPQQIRKRKSANPMKEVRNPSMQSRVDGASSTVIQGFSLPISFHCDQSFKPIARSLPTRLETNPVTQSNSDQSFTFQHPVNGSLPFMTEHSNFTDKVISSVDPDTTSNYLLDLEQFDGSQDPFPMIGEHRITSYDHTETTGSLYHALGNNQMNRSYPNNHQTSGNILPHMNLSLDAGDDELFSAIGIDRDTSSAHESIAQYIERPISHDF